MAFMVGDAAQQFHPPLRVPQQEGPVSLFQRGASRVWHVVVLSVQEGFSKISEVFLRIFASTRLGGVRFVRQLQNQIENLQNQKGELEVRVARLQQDRMNLLGQRDLAWDERNQMQVERDQATQARDLLQVNHDHLQGENGRCVGERDFAIQHRQLLVQENGHLMRERALALEQQERLQHLNDTLVTRLEGARDARDGAFGETGQAEKQLERLGDELNVVPGEQERDRDLESGTAAAVDNEALNAAISRIQSALDAAATLR